MADITEFSNEAVALQSIKSRRATLSVLGVATLVILAACGKGAGGGGDSNNTISGVVSDQQRFETTLYTELKDAKYGCANCHSAAEGEGVPPAFTNSNVAVAYEAATKLVDRQAPSKSRILTKLGPPTKCTPPHCSDAILELKDSVLSWLAPNGGGNTTVISSLLSKPTSLEPGIFASIKSKRVSNGLVALYLFRPNPDNSVPSKILDLTADHNPATNKDSKKIGVDLTLSPSGWSVEKIKDVPTGGLAVSNSVAAYAKADLASPNVTSGSEELYNKIVGINGAGGSMAYTIELWVKPTSVRNGAALSATNPTTNPASMVTYSASSTMRNFTLGQSRTEWTFRNSSSITGVDTALGTPNLSTSGSQAKNNEIQHIVATFDKTNGRKIYINGIDSGAIDEKVDANATAPLSTWTNTGYVLQFGSETSDNSNHWTGTYYLAAIYDRVLGPDEIANNFAVGYKDPQVVQFDIANVTGVEGAKIEFLASALDDSSYLFARPTYIGPSLNNLRVKGIEIVVNGSVSAVGQGFRNIDTTLNGSDIILTNIGSAVGQDVGPAVDQLALSFEVVGTRKDSRPAPLPPEDPSLRMESRSVVPRSGVRTFDQINDTMSSLTGVPKNFTSNPTFNGLSGAVSINTATKFAQVREQLPVTPNLMGFSSAQQVAITVMASEYCTALVADTNRRNTKFGTVAGFTYNMSPAKNAFPAAQRSAIINSFANKMAFEFLGVPAPQTITADPDAASPATKLKVLFDQLAPADATTDEAKNSSFVIANVCAAALSSAAVMMH